MTDFKEATIACQRAALETQRAAAASIKEIEVSILAHEMAQVEIGKSIARTEANVELILGELRSYNQRLAHYMDDHDKLGASVTELRREQAKLRASAEGSGREQR